VSNSIEIISWNVNGIRAVASKEALKWIDERDTDILCLQEIKALPEQIPDTLFLKQHNEVLVNSADKKGYSGTATFSAIKSDFNSTCKHIDLLNEGRVVEQHF